MTLTNAERTGTGLSFVMLSVISPPSVLAASNSSAWSYTNFIRDAEQEKAARESLAKFRLQSWLVSAAMGAVGGVATRSVKWGAAAFIAGGVVTEALYWDMVQVVDKAGERNRAGNAPPPPTGRTFAALVSENPKPLHIVI